MADGKKLNEMLAGIWDSLTDEQKAKAKECKSADELIKLAGEEGIELPDEVLDAVAGGVIYQHKDDYGRTVYDVLDDKNPNQRPYGTYYSLSQAVASTYSLGLSSQILRDEWDFAEYNAHAKCEEK